MNERWIDGFNVLHRMPEVKTLLDTDLEEARNRLLRKIAPSVKPAGERWIVIFDGTRVTRYMAPGHIEVVFAESADAWILSRLNHHPNPRSVTIVTGDEKDIGRPARDLGARIQSSRSFLRSREQRSHRPQPDAGSEKPPSPSAGEVEEWLRIFGEE